MLHDKPVLKLATRTATETYKKTKHLTFPLLQWISNGRFRASEGNNQEIMNITLDFYLAEKITNMFSTKHDSESLSNFVLRNVVKRLLQGFIFPCYFGHINDLNKRKLFIHHHIKYLALVSSYDHIINKHNIFTNYFASNTFFKIFEFLSSVLFDTYKFQPFIIGFLHSHQMFHLFSPIQDKKVFSFGKIYCRDMVSRLSLSFYQKKATLRTMFVSSLLTYHFQ